VQKLHALRANTIKGIVYNSVKPELKYQNHGSEIQVECGYRNYKIALFPCKYLRKALDKYDSKQLTQL
jgi:hypothetical protein